MDPRVKPEFHIDIESICGGRILDLYRLWKAVYGEDQEKIYIILVSGLNDVTICTSQSVSQSVALNQSTSRGPALTVSYISVYCLV